MKGLDPAEYMQHLFALGIQDVHSTSEPRWRFGESPHPDDVG